jgi:uncharacterized membrane protein
MDEEDSDLIQEVLDVIEYVALGLELLSVAIIVTGVVVAIWTAARSWLRASEHVFDRGELYRVFKVQLGNTLLLGLEVLVAADVVRTIALEPSFENAAILGLLVLIRTFLSWSLVVEIEHRWPWQGEAAMEVAVERGEGEPA